MAAGVLLSPGRPPTGWRSPRSKGVAVFEQLEQGRQEARIATHDLTAQNLDAALRRHLRELRQLGPQALVDDRYAKFRKLGPVTSPAPGDGA